jgi:hypothetical protein
LHPPRAPDEFDDKLLVTVILRLVLERTGELDHGEVVDVGGNVHGRFNRWSAAMRLVRAWTSAHVVKRP